MFGTGVAYNRFDDYTGKMSNLKGEGWLITKKPAFCALVN